MTAAALVAALVGASAVVTVTAALARCFDRRAPVYAACATAAALATSVLLATTRRAWESAVRRPGWLADAAHGRWLDRGVDWLVAAAALGLAGALAYAAGREHLPAARVAWAGAALVGVGAAAAMLWGNRALP